MDFDQKIIEIITVFMYHYSTNQMGWVEMKDLRSEIDIYDSHTNDTFWIYTTESVMIYFIFLFKKHKRRILDYWLALEIKITICRSY